MEGGQDMQKGTAPRRGGGKAAFLQVPLVDQMHQNQNHLEHLSQCRFLDPTSESESLVVGLKKPQSNRLSKEPSYTVGGNVNWCSHYGEQCGGSLKN